MFGVTYNICVNLPYVWTTQLLDVYVFVFVHVLPQTVASDLSTWPLPLFAYSEGNVPIPPLAVTQLLLLC